MPLVFNPLNPLSWWAAMAPKAVYPTQPKVPAGTPIIIRPTASDAGLSWRRGTDELTLTGVAAGPKYVGNPDFGGYEEARGLSFSLDADRAPTVDIFGKTNYTEKNGRLFTLMTRAGASALECAQALAKKVNAENDFRAKVQANDDGSATIQFRRR